MEWTRQNASVCNSIHLLWFNFKKERWKLIREIKGLVLKYVQACIYFIRNLLRILWYNPYGCLLCCGVVTCACTILNCPLKNWYISYRYSPAIPYITYTFNFKYWEQDGIAFLSCQLAPLQGPLLLVLYVLSTLAMHNEWRGLGTQQKRALMSQSGRGTEGARIYSLLCVSTEGEIIFKIGLGVERKDTESWLWGILVSIASLQDRQTDTEWERESLFCLSPLTRVKNSLLMVYFLT